MLKFVDAVISGDEAVEKLSFAEYAEAKTRELMGKDKPVTEPPQGTSLQESIITPLIDISGSDPIIVRVRADETKQFEEVGKVIYEDDGNDSEDMFFVKKDNSRVKIGDGSAQELVAFIEQNYLTGEK